MGSLSRRGQAKARACASCEQPLSAGSKICACGAATDEMSFEERARYEVERWRSWRERSAV